MNDYRILVVDDEEDLCEILKFNLENEGYEVDTANSAEEALKMNIGSYNLLLLDVMMGEISGFKMASLLKKDKKTAQVPIIFITAKDTENDTVTGFNLGADDYISKPFSLREVIARVKAVLRRTQQGEPERAPEQISYKTLVIDIVKKKTGESLGVEKYAERIQVTDSHPLRDVKVTREETLKALNIYEKLKDFPVKSYKQAYLQMKKFCKKTGFQFDIISPNNILIDTKAKKINLIDPVTPKVNKPVHGDNADFSKYHGCDSLYPVICDFIMQKEHLENLTADEKLKWKKSINVIIAKCISAGKIAGFDRNIKQLRVLYERIERFWNTNELCNRYDNFIDMYSGTINQEKTITAALNYKNSEQERIKEISRLDAANFEEIKPVFEKILEAPHQPKVEFPEIINAVLDKVFEYGSDAKSLVPALELLFDKEIFCTTKKRLYRLFIALEPENKKFLDEIGKSAKNPIEKMLFKQEFTDLYKKSGKHSQEIYKDAVSGATIPQELADKLWISRTCTNTGSMQEISIKNMIKAYNYIESVKNRKPEVADLVKLHKIVLADTPEQELIGGRLRTPETDELVRQIFHVTKDPKSVVNDYSASKDVVEDLKKLDEYINKNYDTMDCFTHAANIFSEVIRIHPFLNGNGRAARLFTEEFLLSKGYRLDKWPVYFNSRFDYF